MSPGITAAADIFVTTQSDVLIWPDGECSLREAVINANDDAATYPDCAAGVGPDTIHLPSGTYYLNRYGRDEDHSETGDIDIRSVITIDGDVADNTTVDGNTIDRVFDVHHGAVLRILDLSITRGDHGVYYGGEERGSAIRASSASLEVYRSSIHNNGIGHAIDVLQPASGMSRPFIMRWSSVHHNDGGVNITCEGPLVAPCKIDIVNNTFSENFEGLAYRGAYNTSLLPFKGIVANNTITGNVFGLFANDQGTFGGSLLTNVLTFSGNIVAGNTDHDCLNHYGVDDGYNVDGLEGAEHCDFSDPSSIYVHDDQVAPLADNGGPTLTNALLEGVEAIDLIPTAACLTSTDQRGIPRPQGPACDAGAFERLEPNNLIVELKPVYQQYLFGRYAGDLVIPDAGRLADDEIEGRLDEFGQRILAVGVWLELEQWDPACRELDALLRHTDRRYRWLYRFDGPIVDDLYGEFAYLKDAFCDESPKRLTTTASRVARLQR